MSRGMLATVTMLISILLTGIALGMVISGANRSPVLPAGFTVQHADGITYVCSVNPVWCTGNEPTP